MRKTASSFLFVFLFLFAISARSQNDSTQKNNLKLMRFEMNASFGSNHITGTTALPFAFKSSVGSDDIDKSSQLIFNGNRSGTQSHIEAQFKAGKHEFSMGYYATLAASYSKNLFQLVFEGNAPYAGQKMDLKVNAKQLSYGKVSYSLGQWKSRLSTKKQSLVYKHHISLYGISKYARAKTTGANSLYTSESGIDVEGVLNYRYQANNQTDFKGGGLGVGTYAYSRNGATAKIFRVENLGVGLIKANEQVYSKDSAWTYSGLNFTLGNQQNFSSVGDSVNRLIYDETKSDARIILLPVHISYSIQTPKKNYGVQYTAMPGYLPQLHYIRKFYTPKNNTYGIGLKAGGWGLLNSYLQYNQFLKKEGRSIQLQMSGIESLLLPYPSFALQMRIDL